MKKVLLAYWPSIRAHSWFFIGTSILMCIGVAIDAVQPYFIRSLVGVFTAETVEIQAAKKIFLWMVILAVIHILFRRMFDYLLARAELRVMQDLDKRSFAKILQQSKRFYENTFAGSLVKRVSRFRNAFETIADAFFIDFGRDAIMIAAVLVAFVWGLPSLAWVFCAWIVVFLGTNLALTLWKLPFDRASAVADSALGGRLADSFGNVATIKAFAMEESEQRTFDPFVASCAATGWRAWRASILINFVQGLLMAVFELFLIRWMINGWEQGTITVAEFVFFQTYLVWLFTHLWDFGNTMRRVFQHLANAQEMADIFALTPEVRDATGARPLIVQEGNVTFDAVNFSYCDVLTREHHDVHDFTLRIPAGHSIAFVGHTGAGKSTIVQLLLRNYDLYSGCIRIDGRDIAQVTQESLRQQIALVPQQPDLFHRSIRENIAFGRPGASEEEIVVAAKHAHAWEFIERLHGGMDTLVGERGVKLSGGERQRIALARAFLANAPILILDEATSSLDSETEHLIQLAIADLLKGRTSIVIAHRLSTIMRTNQIIVMEHGEIVEQGTHDELLANKSMYANLWAHQIGGYIE